MAEPNMYWIVNRNSEARYRLDAGWTTDSSKAKQFTYPEALDQARQYGYTKEGNTSIEPIVKELVDG